MPIPEKYLADFEEGGLYHVYNRTNNQELLFVTDDNRQFFLNRFKEIVGRFVDTYCWNLQPNHFHFVIRIKSEKEIIRIIQDASIADRTITESEFLSMRVANLQKAGNSKAGNSEISLSILIEQTFKRLFQSYALAFNKQHHRKGNLFYKPFKRVRIKSDSQFTMALVYVHANAAKHGLVQDFEKYEWSSWGIILSDRPTSLLRDEIIQWFGSLELCIEAHKTLAKYYYDCEVAIED